MYIKPPSYAKKGGGESGSSEVWREGKGREENRRE
jgi:hypothetical protein